ncbi:MAG TPA: hypothetical protein PLD84_16260, partial [Chitinophagales bacterium]|nr:hypothetical protein [Chitinophagales bacterium]
MKTFYSKSLSYILAAAILSFGWVNSFATKHTINVQNFFFSPSSLTINLGDTIVWQWISGIHTTTSLTIPAGATAWDSPIKSSVTKFTYVPAVLGTYNYKCTPHFVTKNMVGNFTVICPSASVSISAAGPTTFCKGDQVTLSQSSAGTFSTYQWQLDAVNISGATTSSYNATASGSHTLMVTSSCGSTATSNAVAVTVNKKPKADVTPAGPLT